MKALSPCLWFERNAKEAVDFYVSVFPNSKITDTVYYTADGPGGKVGDVLVVEFELNGSAFMALNGGVHQKYSDALSLSVPCDTQEEIDMLWDKLTADGGEPMQCGWLHDKYGVAWQIDSTELRKMIADKNTAKAKAAMEAMMEMVKLDIATIKKAYDAA